MSSSNFGIELIPDQSIVNFITPSASIISLKFPDAPEDLCITNIDNTISLLIKEDIRAIISSAESKLIINLTQDQPYPRSVAINIIGAKIEVIGVSGYIVNDTERLPWIISQGGIQNYTQDSLNLSMIGVEMTMEISTPESDDFSILSHPFTNETKIKVPAGRRPPDFSVGVFDDPAFLRPRPVRLGIPVISTVPTNGTAITADDLAHYELGEGTAARKMFFRVLSNASIPPTVPVSLRIYLPDGMDTVSPSVDVPLVYLSTDTAVGNIYYGEYLFHREDTVRYVDGFTYLSVYLHMTMQYPLSMRLQVGSAIAENVTEDFTLFSVKSISDTKREIGPALAMNFSVIEPDSDTVFTEDIQPLDEKNTGNSKTDNIFQRIVKSIIGKNDSS